MVLLMAARNVLVVPEQCVLLLADLDGAAAELRNQNLVAGLDAERNALAILVVKTGADSEDLALVELLDGAIGKEDASGGLGLGLHALHEDAVEERCEGLDVLEEGLVESIAVSLEVGGRCGFVGAYHDCGCDGGLLMENRWIIIELV
jgi:hypothetical protein